VDSATISVAGGQVGRLSALEWLAGSLTAQTLRFFDITGRPRTGTRGDLGADITVTGAQDTNTFRVAGLADGSEISLAGNLVSGSFGGMRGSNLTVGDLAGNARSITSFRLLGLDDAGLGGFAFINANVLAASMQSVRLTEVKFANSGTPFGIKSNSIANYLRDGVSLTNLTTIGDFDAQGDFRVQVV
jgi:hypothetical protein